ncbi:MAG: hypothetical protein QXZ38_01280 [Candidatus Micrarchaeaceae archaeon]
MLWLKGIVALFIIAFLQLFVAVHASLYALSGANSTTMISSNISSTSPALVFESNATNNLVDCDGHGISSTVAVIFGNNTYNNTVVNCSINGAIVSMHNAQNNLINVSGTYSLDFYGNGSNVGLGNFVHLLVYARGTNFSVARFIQIMPKALMGMPCNLISMATTKSYLENCIKPFNYTLPRFGIYYPNTSSNGSSYFPVEAEQIYKNKIINFDPYVLYSPYLGYDMVSFTYFDATSQSTFRPTYIMPLIYPYEIFPAYRDMHINFTIIFHNYTRYSKFRLLNGWQNDPNNTLAATFYNLTNGTLSYDAGVLKPGFYQNILLLDTPYEHENSTTLEYSVGLSYCADNNPGIVESGYYPFAYNSLRDVNVFWFSSNQCSLGARISASNVTVNCMGGSINATEYDFEVYGSSNVTIENCVGYGRALYAYSSKVNLTNDTFIANSANQTAIVANLSTVSLHSVNFFGYADTYTTANGTVVGIGFTNNATKVQATKQMVELQTGNTQYQVLPAEAMVMLGAYACVLILVVLLYLLVNKR